MKYFSRTIILFGLLAMGILTGMTAAERPVFQPPPHGQAPVESATPDATIHLPLIMQPSLVYLPLVISESVTANPTPKSGAERQSLNVYLAWDVLDPGSEALTYTILLEADDATPDVVIAENLTSRTFDPVTFEEDTLYYWQVIALDINGAQFASPIWRFRTDLFPYPPEVDAMVTVPAGEFQMGCDAENSGYVCFSNQTPLHPVYLDAFEIDKFEVTNMRYRECVAAGVCNSPQWNASRHRNSYYDNPAYDYYPVMWVSHWDAQDFCRWDGKRLPTEAEWEKTARGPIDTRPWPWGNEEWDCTRVNRCSWDSAQVDQYHTNQSPYGAVNMSGNMFEWVQDYYSDDYYTQSPYYNPINAVQSQRIPYFSIRGGSYHDNWWYARVNHRSGGHRGGTPSGDSPGVDTPLFRTFRVGFRCAKSLPNSAQ